MTDQMETVKSSEQLYREWLEHRHFRYRGCAPDADNPLRMAGNPDLPVGAHHGPDAFAPALAETGSTRNGLTSPFVKCGVPVLSSTGQIHT